MVIAPPQRAHRLGPGRLWRRQGSRRSFSGRSYLRGSDQDRTENSRSVAKEVGSYGDHRAAVSKPELYSPEISSQAKRLSTLTLKLQWVRGDVKKAEELFARINQQAATITPQELELLRDRRKPTAIASRAILRRGSGHKYWQHFSSERQEEIKEHASELHRLIFEPTLRYPIKSLDIPLGEPCLLQRRCVWCMI